MTGLMRSNFYAARANETLFAGVLCALCAFVAAIDNDVPTPLIGFMLLSLVGFSFQAMASLRRECGGKWGRYKLTAPVRRRDVLRSQMIGQLIWLAVGAGAAAAGAGLSVLLHGNPFDLATDPLMIYTVGISVNLWMGALFFPLYVMAGEERSEAVLAVSLLGAIIVVMALVSAINALIGPDAAIAVLLLSAGLLLVLALAAFAAAYCLAAWLFLRKDC